MAVPCSSSGISENPEPVRVRQRDDARSGCRTAGCPSRGDLRRRRRSAARRWRAPPSEGRSTRMSASESPCLGSTRGAACGVRHESQSAELDGRSRGRPTARCRPPSRRAEAARPRRTVPRAPRISATVVPGSTGMIATPIARHARKKRDARRMIAGGGDDELTGLEASDRASDARHSEGERSQISDADTHCRCPAHESGRRFGSSRQSSAKRARISLTLTRV